MRGILYTNDADTSITLQAYTQALEYAAQAGADTTRALGLGQIFGRFEGDNDGTVAVAETRLPGLTAHAAIPCSHTGLAFSAPVVDLVDRFLRHGHF